MSNPQNDDWDWFWQLLAPLRASARNGVHPSREILHAYLNGQVRDLWRVGTRSRDSDHWTLTEISQHALVCRDCAQQLALLRQRELGHVTPWHDLWYRFPSAIRTHFAVYALALLALFALNAFFVMVLPAPMVALPCTSPGDRAGPAQPANPQTPDINLKLEGLNRPAKLPSSLSGACAPVPAPRPLWQTWWIGWVFPLWTILLGLHMLWEWLAGPVPQHPVTVSTALRSFV
ncbi:MAG: hypothetical protein ACK4HB_03225 [Candidatus Bipolaricaulia bacterium]